MILSCRIFIIVVVRLQKCLEVIDFIIIGIEDIFVWCRCSDEVIGSSVLNTMLDVLHLEVHQLWV